MDTPYQMPFYARAALIFIGVFAFVFTMHIAQNIIIPLVFATLIAILMNPFVNLLVRFKFNRIIAITIAVIAAMAIVLGFIYIITSQFNMFWETYPALKIKFNQTSTDLVGWVSEKFNVKEKVIEVWIADAESEAVSSFAVGEKLTEAGRIAVVGMLLPVYMFLILYYKTFLLEFIHKLFKTHNHFAVGEVLTKSKSIVQSYLVGLFFEIVIVAILNTTGLLLLGIDYAIILGVTGALLNVIPYIGGISATLLPMIIAFVTKDSLLYPFLVLVLYVFVQLIDNNFVVPKIVASRVKINALVSIIVVLVGGTLWGIPGMFLSIPLTAILKVIFDHIEPLKPWGFLLGDIVPTKTGIPFIKIKKKTG